MALARLDMMMASPETRRAVQHCRQDQYSNCDSYSKFRMSDGSCNNLQVSSAFGLNVNLKRLSWKFQLEIHSISNASKVLKFNDWTEFGLFLIVLNPRSFRTQNGVKLSRALPDYCRQTIGELSFFERTSFAESDEFKFESNSKSIIIDGYNRSANFSLSVSWTRSQWWSECSKILGERWPTAERPVNQRCYASGKHTFCSSDFKPLTGSFWDNSTGSNEF